MESYRPSDEARKILKPETMALFESPYRLSKAVHDCGVEMGLAPASVINAEDWSEEEEDNEDEEEDLSDLE